jgi:hypothetical protein
MRRRQRIFAIASPLAVVARIPYQEARPVSGGPPVAGSVCLISGA